MVSLPILSNQDRELHQEEEGDCQLQNGYEVSQNETMLTAALSTDLRYFTSI